MKRTFGVVDDAKPCGKLAAPTGPEASGVRVLKVWRSLYGECTNTCKRHHNSILTAQGTKLACKSVPSTLRKEVRVAH